MERSFGPWTTAIHDHGQVKLATFWKRRFKALALADATRPASGRSRFIVVAIGILGCGLPTLRAEPAKPAATPETATPAAAPDEHEESRQMLIAQRAERLKLLEKNVDPDTPMRRRPNLNRTHSVDFNFGQPIREGFDFLGDLYRVGIRLPLGDFRERSLDFKFTDKTLPEALETFCEHLGWEWDTDGYIIYAGPAPPVKEFRRLVATRDERRRNYPPGLARRLQDRVSAEFLQQDLGPAIRMLSAATNVPMRLSDAKLAAEQVSFSMAKVGSLPLDVFLDLLSLKYDLKWHIDDTGTVITARKPAEQARLQDGPEYIVIEENGLEIEDVEFQGEQLQEAPGEMIVPAELKPLNGRTLDPIVPIEEQPLPILRRFEHITEHSVAIT